MGKTKKSKIRKRIIISAIFIILILIAAYLFLSLKPKTNSYASVTAGKGDIETFYSYSGNVEAKNRQNVMSEKVMQISEIKVKEGDKVKKGDTLFTTTTDDEITAGIDGEVSGINIEEDEQVMAGISLMEIVDYDNLQINVKVDEYSIPDIKIGKKVTVHINAINKEIKGKVYSVSKEGQTVNGVTYFTAVIDIDKNEAIKVGMSAEVKFQSASVKDVVTLPMSVIQFDENNDPYVYLKDSQNKLVKTYIKTGINDGTTVEVKSVINSGDVIYYKSDSSSNTGGMGFGRGNRGGV